MSGDVTGLSAVTLTTRDMSAALRFYRDTLRLQVVHGGDDARLTSLAAGAGFVNVVRSDAPMHGFWGRVILYVDDVDAAFARVVAAGYRVDGEPADAVWGERYVHVYDADGHEISLAKPTGR
mgnify:CR=1 FL=1